MSCLHVVNLGIDNDWDSDRALDAFFPTRHPGTTQILDSYFAFGHFQAQPGDGVFVKYRSHPAYLDYLSRYFTVCPEFATADLEGLGSSRQFELDCVGRSQFEERLALAHPNLVFPQGQAGVAEYQALNRKSYLVELAEKLKFNFPATRVVTVDELLAYSNSSNIVLKYEVSAGGRGVFVIDEPRPEFIARLHAQLSPKQRRGKILIQERVHPERHFYSVCLSGGADLKVFAVEYDRHNSSWCHMPELAPPPTLAAVARMLGDELVRAGYQGGFGFDGFLSREGVLYPAIDLNVRKDKTRFIQSAAHKLGLDGARYFFIRHRFRGMTAPSFQVFWRQTFAKLDDDRFEIIPALFANVFQEKAERRLQEVSFFLVSRDRAPLAPALFAARDRARLCLDSSGQIKL